LTKRLKYNIRGNCPTLIRSVVALLLLIATGNSQNREYKFSSVLNFRPVADSAAFRTGLDLLVENNFVSLKGKKIAIIANNGSCNRLEEHIFDVFKTKRANQCLSFVQVREDLSKSEGAGFIYHDSELESSVRYFALTTDNYRIDAKMINGAGLILLDLQDSGIRESLVLGVLIETLRFSAVKRIPVIILDRPNPLQAVAVEGPLSDVTPFAAGCRMPARPGMTLAELALLINEENWLKTEKGAILSVIPMANYTRGMRWQQTGLKWRYPAGSVIDEETAFLYAGLNFLQYTNISWGAGTSNTYQFIGAPWLASADLIRVLKEQNLHGVDLYPVKFTPGRGYESTGKVIYMNQECSGVSMRINDFSQFEPYKFGSALISAIARLYPRSFQWSAPEQIDYIFGNADFRTWINIGADIRPMYALWIADVTAYQKARGQYLLYPA